MYRLGSAVNLTNGCSGATARESETRSLGYSYMEQTNRLRSDISAVFFNKVVGSFGVPSSSCILNVAVMSAVD